MKFCSIEYFFGETGDEEPDVDESAKDSPAKTLAGDGEAEEAPRDKARMSYGDGNAKRVIPEGDKKEGVI